jgi:hypothetical protein
VIINAHIVACGINLDNFSLIKRSDEFLMNKMGERVKLAEQASKIILKVQTNKMIIVSR